MFAGWIGAVIRAFFRLVWNAIKGALNSPFAILDWTSRRYFQPGVPWLAFLLLILWSAIEATIFTFTLRPTMNELLADLTGFEPNPVMLTALLYIFLFFLVGGSFACVQALNDAIKIQELRYHHLDDADRDRGGHVRSAVPLSRAGRRDHPVDGPAGFNLGIAGVLGLAFAGWLGVRGMTWFLFGRYGTPALIAVLARETISHGGSVDIAPPRQPDFWKAPITALKAEMEWFKTEAREMFELLTLPVLQLMASGFNFWLVVLLGRPHFTLPFRSLEEVLAATPLSIERKAVAAARRSQGPHEARASRLAALAALVLGCHRMPKGAPPPKSTLVIGLDVSGSFRKGEHFEDAIDFASLYIYAHMKGFRDLRQPTDVFVGTMGGQRTGEAKTFHPIQDLTGKSPSQIAASLKAWFPEDDPITDFNAFFERVAVHVQRQNLGLAPLSIVMFSDGVPDIPGVKGDDLYRRINVDSAGVPLPERDRAAALRFAQGGPALGKAWCRGSGCGSGRRTRT